MKFVEISLMADGLAEFRERQTIFVLGGLAQWRGSARVLFGRLLHHCGFLRKELLRLNSIITKGNNSHFGVDDPVKIFFTLL